MSIDRRHRFREFMGSMDPSCHPETAFDKGFYVEPVGATSRRIATRLEIEPSSCHLLVGGTGTGKTSELISIQRALASVEDLRVDRVDVLGVQRSDALGPGVLVAIVARAMCGWLSSGREDNEARPEIATAMEAVEEVSNGEFVLPEYAYDDPSPEVWRQGILRSPPGSEPVARLERALRVISAACAFHPVFLLDGLDRLPETRLFYSMIVEDLAALRRCGIGVVIVGPQHLRFSQERIVEGLFTELHLHGAVVLAPGSGSAFLREVLMRRDHVNMLGDDVNALLVELSGGVVRDLISMTRSSAEEAYLSGSDVVTNLHVEGAADRFGRARLLGITAEMTERLKSMVPRKMSLGRLARQGAILSVLSSDADISNLMRGLIIEVPTTPVRYIPHPTIVPLIGTL